MTNEIRDETQLSRSHGDEIRTPDPADIHGPITDRVLDRFEDDPRTRNQYGENARAFRNRRPGHDSSRTSIRQKSKAVNGTITLSAASGPPIAGIISTLPLM